MRHKPSTVRRVRTKGTGVTGGVSRRRGGTRTRIVIGVIAIVDLTVYGAVLLGSGVFDFGNERALASRGVPTVATVTATSGYGRDTIQVSYGVHGRQVQGIRTADPAGLDRGEQLPVVYDPGDPTVVSLPSAVGDTSSAWGNVIAGSILLLLFPVSLLISVLAAQRRRRRAVQVRAGLDGKLDLAGPLADLYQLGYWFRRRAWRAVSPFRVGERLIKTQNDFVRKVSEERGTGAPPNGDPEAEKAAGATLRAGNCRSDARCHDRALHQRSRAHPVRPGSRPRPHDPAPAAQIFAER